MDEGLELRRRIDEINTKIYTTTEQLASLTTERKRLKEQLHQFSVEARSVVYRIQLAAYPKKAPYGSFTKHFGVFSTREKATKYASTFSTHLDHHDATVSVEAVASETLDPDWVYQLDKPVYGHNFS